MRMRGHQLHGVAHTIRGRNSAELLLPVLFGLGGLGGETRQGCSALLLRQQRPSRKNKNRNEQNRDTSHGATTEGKLRGLGDYTRLIPASDF